MEAAGRENMIQNSAVRDRVADADNEARMPKEESRGLAGWLAGKYNRLYRAVAPTRVPPTSSRDFKFIRDLASTPTDINEHLERIFLETLLLRPSLIVELGVRCGVSTSVFERAAAIFGARIISVDLTDRSTISQYAFCEFVQSDDIGICRPIFGVLPGKGNHSFDRPPFHRYQPLLRAHRAGDQSMVAVRFRQRKGYFPRH